MTGLAGPSGGGPVLSSGYGGRAGWMMGWNEEAL